MILSSCGVRSSRVNDSCCNPGAGAADLQFFSAAPANSRRSAEALPQVPAATAILPITKPQQLDKSPTAWGPALPTTKAEYVGRRRRMSRRSQEVVKKSIQKRTRARFRRDAGPDGSRFRIRAPLQRCRKCSQAKKGFRVCELLIATSGATRHRFLGREAAAE